MCIYVLASLGGMTNDTAGASARAPRGSSGLPAGITKARKRYQARLSYVPTGSTKKEMRPIGTFKTVDEAVAALAEAQTKYAEGGEAAVWQKEKEQRAPRGSVRITCPYIPAHCWHRLREHSTCWCAQVVRPEKKSKPEPKYVVKMPGVGRGNNPTSRNNLHARKKKEQDENEGPAPQYSVLPSSINNVSCASMSAFFLQDPGPWAALYAAVDGSGELRM